MESKLKTQAEFLEIDAWVFWNVWDSLKVKCSEDILEEG